MVFDMEKRVEGSCIISIHANHFLNASLISSILRLVWIRVQMSPVHSLLNRTVCLLPCKVDHQWITHNFQVILADPLSFEKYERIGRKMMWCKRKVGIYAHAVLTTMWNLMCRVKNCRIPMSNCTIDCNLGFFLQSLSSLRSVWVQKSHHQW